MIFIPVPGVVKAELIYSSAGQVVENVFHYKLTSGGEPTTENMTELAGDLKLWWTGSLAPMVPTGVTLDLIRVTLLTTRTSPGIEFNAGLPASGGDNVNVQMPNNVTYTVKWTTGLRGRSYRGRTYGVGLTQAQIAADRNHLTPAAISTFVTEYSELLQREDGAWTMGVASYMLDKVFRSEGVFTPFTSCSVDSTLDSIRRRLPGRGQ